MRVFLWTYSTRDIFLSDRSLEYPHILLSSHKNRSVKKKIKLTPKIRSSQGSIVLPSNTWGTLRIQNQGKTINLSGKILSFGNTGIQEGPALFTFTGYALATPSSLDRSREPTRIAT